MQKVILLALVVVSVFAFLANPFMGVPGCDSSIFIYVARRMMEGQVPYLDVFDQKGLLIYVLDAIGWSLGGVMGVWALDVLAFGLALFLLTRIVCANPVTIVIWIVLYHLVACGGNMPEMWIIVFSALAYGLTLTAQVDERRKWLVMGVCVAQILMLKLNMISVVVPIAIVWLLRGASVRVGSWIALGFAIGFFPYVLYFTMKGAWGALWEVYVQYNAQYAARGGWCPVVSRAFYPVAALWAANLWMVIRTRRQLAWINFAYLTAAWGLVLLSGGSVRYYGPVLPACIVPLTFCVEMLETRLPRFWRRCSVGVMAMSFLVILGLVFLRNRSAGAVRAQYEELRQFTDRIEDCQSVTVLGCDCHVYQVLNVVCPGRFPFHGTVAQCSSKYRKAMIKDVEQRNSRYLVIPKGVLNTEGSLGVKWAKEPIAKHYDLIAKCSNYELMERKPFCVALTGTADESKK